MSELTTLTQSTPAAQTLLLHFTSTPKSGHLYQFTSWVNGLAGTTLENKSVEKELEIIKVLQVHFYPREDFEELSQGLALVEVRGID
jgi:hypothetical protein